MQVRVSCHLQTELIPDMFDMISAQIASEAMRAATTHKFHHQFNLQMILLTDSVVCETALKLKII